MSDYDTITTSSDTEELRVGDTIYAMANGLDGLELKGTVTAVEVDGDVDDEGRAFGYTYGRAILDDGREFDIDSRGFGSWDRERGAPKLPEFDTQAHPNAYYE